MRRVLWMIGALMLAAWVGSVVAQAEEPAPPKKDKWQTVEIVKMDLEARTMDTIEPWTKEKMTYKLTPDCRVISAKDSPTPKSALSDFKVGERVNLKYVEQDGARVASAIALNPPKPKKEAKPEEKKE